ncbi:hypothetical protein [Dielma fastidiosa]|jgi:hypothetical protein|uniref:Uncharacterized protein n=1 Tax=Dielma fastidiosa TaxID=1034346 RepID=A0A318KPK1_9FIRM|nr:hypothetical protein [Dielma fastidiosa]PXX78472.1 hypothetical protein DES51_10712 [Dielma fastidiosa]
MDWKTIKLLSLQKMFLITGNSIVEDETTLEYLNKMWGAANEAMIRLATIGKTIMRQKTIDLSDERIISADKMYINLLDFCTDLFNVNTAGVRLNEEPFSRFELYGHTMVLEPQEGMLSVLYYAYPALLKPDSPDDTEIPLDIDAAVLIPLYIASELYKDDDNSLATMYRNQFETGLESLVPKQQTNKARFVRHGAV